MRVIIRGNWSDCVGTDYCHALGIYSDLASAESDARDHGYDNWEPQEQEEECDVEDEGPEYWIEEYDQSVHDDYRAGGGSFAEEFERMET